MDEFSLKCFLAVAETRSFTQAAKRVMRTQSAVTQQIGKLEHRLGKKLFERGKTVSLTPDGELFRTYAMKIFSLQREIEDRFQHAELEGELSFGVPEDFATQFLSEILVDFARIHPRIFLRVECDLTARIYERFQKGELEMVLVKMKQPETLVKGKEVWSEPLEWVGKWNPSETTDPIPLVIAPDPCVYRETIITALEARGLPWRIAFTSPSFVGLTAAVEAGVGISAIPQTLIPNHIDRIKGSNLPELPELHVSLLRKKESKPSLDTLEAFLLDKIAREHPT